MILHTATHKVKLLQMKNDRPINTGIIALRTKLSFKKFLQKRIVALEKRSDRNILHGSGVLLTEKQKAWAGASLRKETIFQLKLRADREGRE